jgi:hypothetical protein
MTNVRDILLHLIYLFKISISVFKKPKNSKVYQSFNLINWKKTNETNLKFHAELSST